MTPDPKACEFRRDDFWVRPWRRADADALYEAARVSINSVGHWLPWCHAGYACADGEAWIGLCHAAWATNNQYAFGIFTPDGVSVLGGIGLNRFDAARRSANLGYWIRGDAQGRGIATAAAAVLVPLAFEHGFERIEIVAAVNNLASRRVAEKLGARCEGVQSGRIEFKGTKLDALVYALSSPEQKRA